MGGESSPQVVLLSSFRKGTGVPPRVRANKFGTIVRALWPEKTAVWLSQVAGCTERHALLLIRGERKPNARIAHAVFGEILDD